MANLAWAFAKVARRDRNLEETIASQVIQKIRSLAPQHLSIIVCSFAQLMAAGSVGQESALAHGWEMSYERGHSHLAGPSPSADEMVEVILDRATRRIQEFDGQGLANLAQSLAKLELKQERRLRAIEAEAAEKIESLSNQELAMLAWSEARLGYFYPRSLRLILDEAKARVEDLTPQDLSVLIWSFARSSPNPHGSNRSEHANARANEETSEVSKLQNMRWQHPGAKALEILSGAVLRCASELCPQDLSTIIWAYGTAKVESPAMMDAVCEECLSKVHRFSPQDMSNSAWAFARLSFLHVELMEVLALQLIQNRDRCKAQHLSITAWSFAKLGIVSEDLLAPIAKELTARILEFDPQGIGNTLWAFAVLSVWHGSLVEAIADRAVKIIADFTPQEMANTAMGLRNLLRWRLQQEEAEALDSKESQLCYEKLHDFLETSSSYFCRKADIGDGASWCDFANVVRAFTSEIVDFQTKDIGGAAREVDARFRNLLFEPVLRCLERTLRVDDGSDGSKTYKTTPGGVFELQEILDEADRAVAVDPSSNSEATGSSSSSNVGIASGSGGLPHLGTLYSKEALLRLGLGGSLSGFGAEGAASVRLTKKLSGEDAGSAEVKAWLQTAQRKCREAEGGRWKIPSTDTVLAYVWWDVQSSNLNQSKDSWQNLGKIYRALRAGDGLTTSSKAVEELLCPLRQHLRRDGHPERQALVELLSSILGLEEEGDDLGREHMEQDSPCILANCKGSVKVYVTQHPCLSCLAVFCQFRRRCPKISLQVEFDSAWATFCGQSRYSSR
eukprot:TRINITY_DN17644_c0_g1_i1.p1 TRINITY_DN17644_c0_g1~~TRINITY_DN17644_c0_g1_i1.p1  ORF type:complete len:907 (-),score=151.30 TRINITY_DN17644_c0_g1_i1:208-2577(-)